MSEILKPYMFSLSKDGQIIRNGRVYAATGMQASERALKAMNTLIDEIDRKEHSWELICKEEVKQKP